MKVMVQVKARPFLFEAGPPTRHCLRGSILKTSAWREALEGWMNGTLAMLVSKCKSSFTSRHGGLIGHSLVVVVHRRRLVLSHAGGSSHGALDEFCLRRCFPLGFI